MSHEGWTNGHAETPEVGEGVLTHPPHSDDPRADEPDASDATEDGHGHDHVSERETISAPARARLLRIKRETRFGVAALLSFLILVTVLILNRGGAKTAIAGKRDEVKSRGKMPPVAQVPAVEPSPAAAPESDSPPPAPKPEESSQPPTLSGATPPLPSPESDSTPIPFPAPEALGDSREKAADPIQLAMNEEAAKNAGDPPLPVATKEDAKAKDKEKEGAAAPAPAPPVEPSAPKGPETVAPPSPTPAPAADGHGMPELPAPARAAAAAPNPGAETSGPTPVAAEPPPPVQPAPASAPTPAPTDLGPAPTPEQPAAAAQNPSPAPMPMSTEPPASVPPATPAPAPSPAVAPPGIESPASGVPPTPPSNPSPGPGDLAPVTTPAPAPAEPPPAESKPVEAAKDVALPNASAGAAPTPSPASEPSPSGGLPNLMTTPEPAPASEPPQSPKAPAEAPAAAAPSSPPAAPGTWVALPNLGKGRSLDDDRFAFDPPSEPAARRIERVSPAPAPAPAAPASDRVNTVDHVVQSRENFWTISRLYYGYGRFWKALWAANRTTVPAPEKLYVGQKIQIPPPEALDRSLFEPEPAARSSSKTAGRSAPPSGSTVSASALRRASRTAGAAAHVSAVSRGETEVELPTSDPFARRREADPDEGVDVAPSPRRVRYRVRAHETLRSIARDTLGDSHRADEILDLNAKVIDDPGRLIPGQVIDLPEDARVGAGDARRRR